MPRLIVLRDRLFGDGCCGAGDATCHIPFLIRPAPLNLAFIHFAACVLFLTGSVMFLPEQGQYFANGCQLFAAGSAMLVAPQGADLVEVMRAHSENWVAEALLNLTYLVGSIFFFIGSFLFEFFTEDSTPYFEAVLLFIFASAGYVIALLGNSVYAAASAPPIDKSDTRGQRMRGLAFLRMNGDMLGCCCFLAGSFLYLPQVGCGTATFEVGAWLFIIGSALILLGSIFSLGVQLRRACGREASPMIEDRTVTQLSDAKQLKANDAQQEASSATV